MRPRIRKTFLDEFMGIEGTGISMLDALVPWGHAPCDAYEAYALALMEHEEYWLATLEYERNRFEVTK